MKQEKILATVALISVLGFLICDIIGQVQSNKGFHLRAFYIVVPFILFWSVMAISKKPN